MKLITKEMAPKLIAGYRHSAETGESAKDVVAKYFTPWAGATWYITEGMPLDERGTPLEEPLANFELASDWHLFGFCDLGDRDNAELGYVLLSDLKDLNGPFGLKVERDLYYEGTLNEVLENYEMSAA